MQSRFVIASGRRWQRLAAGLVIGATTVGAGVLAAGGPAGARNSGAASPLAPAPPAPAAQVRVELRRVVGGLDRPVAVVSARDGTGRLFVAERPGTVRIVERSGRLVRKPFINVSKNVGGVAPRAAAVLGDGAREGRGLLGIAFHPNFKSNRLVFVSYTDQKGDLRISRFKANGEAGKAAMNVDAGSERVLLKVARRSVALGAGPISGQGRRAIVPRAADHNGGQLAFGPDRFLYIGVGDGGGAGDPAASAQDRRTLRGKILRIDIDDPVPGAGSRPGAPAVIRSLRPYQIPSTNPFAKVPAFRGEIWALGVRDPRGLSFDRRGGQLWVADSGETLRQEVNRIGAGIAGRNLGWDCREGTVDVSTRHGGAYCATRQFSRPVWNYRPFGKRCSVVGGHVYRGDRLAKQLGGRYLYADHCSGEIWALNERAKFGFSSTLVGSARGITAFGEDEAGELLVTTADGVLHRLNVAGVPDKAAAPAAPAVGQPPVSAPTTPSPSPSPATSPAAAPSSTLPASPTTASTSAATAPPATEPAPARVAGPGKNPALPSGSTAPAPASEPVSAVLGG